MRTIKAFNLSPLHVEEDFGFLKQFHDEAVTLRGGSGGDSESPDEIADEVNPVLDGQISAFETKLDAFDEALKSSSSLPSTALATDADVERDSAWRGANAYVKAMTEHPDVATATAAMEVKRLFDTYGDPTSLAQTEESGVLHNLIQDLKALDAEKARLLALTPWINNLENKEKAFKEAAQKRTDEKSRVIVGVVKQCRSEADNAYRQLVSTVNVPGLLSTQRKTKRTCLPNKSPRQYAPADKSRRGISPISSQELYFQANLLLNKAESLHLLPESRSLHISLRINGHEKYHSFYFYYTNGPLEHECARLRRETVYSRTALHQL